MFLYFGIGLVLYSGCSRNGFRNYDVCFDNERLSEVVGDSRRLCGVNQRGLSAGLQMVMRGHQHSRRADAALRAAALEKARLKRGQIFGNP